MDEFNAKNDRKLSLITLNFTDYLVDLELIPVGNNNFLDEKQEYIRENVFKFNTERIVNIDTVIDNYWMEFMNKLPEGYTRLINVNISVFQRFLYTIDVEGKIFSISKKDDGVFYVYKNNTVSDEFKEPEMNICNYMGECSLEGEKWANLNEEIIYSSLGRVYNLNTRKQLTVSISGNIGVNRKSLYLKKIIKETVWQ